MADPVTAANPLPKTSLHRAIETGQLGWFAAVPERLAVFLRVAGCPPEQVGAWGARLAEVAASAEPAAGSTTASTAEPPAGSAVDESPAGPPAGRPGGNEPPGRRPGRRGVRSALALATVITVAFLIVVAGHIAFYDALGFQDVSQLPVRPAGLAVSTFVFLLIVTVAGCLLGGAFATGASLVPWRVRTRAALPATALAFVLTAAAYVAAGLLVPDGLQFPAVLFVLFVGYGVVSRLINTQRPAHYVAGFAVGIPVVVALWQPALAVGRWYGSVGAVAAAYAAGAAVLAAPLAWWVRRELRRDGLVPAGPTRPNTLLAQLREDIVPSLRSILRETMPSREARRLTAGFGVLVALLPLLALALVLGLVVASAEAGEVAREYGYVPSGRGSALIWTELVVPATVTPRDPDADPAAVCGSPPWSASMIGSDPDGSWVLLRPAGGDGRPPRLVRLPAADYVVQPVLDPRLPDGDPWRGPACG